MIRYGFLPSGTMLKWDIEKVCAFLRETGYQALELLPEWAVGESVGPADRRRVVKAARENGLVLSELILQRDFIVLDEEERAEAVRYIVRAIPLAAEMGIDTVNLFTGPQPWLPEPVVVGKHVRQSTAWEWLFRAMDRILPVAEKHGVRLAVENVWGMLCHDFFTNQYLQKRYESRMLGVNLDPSHDVLYGNTDMRFLVEGWGREKIFHVHLKDAVGVPQDGLFVFPLLGEGIVEWKAFFTALRDIGYDGCASVEFESWGYLKNMADGRHEECAKISMDAIRRISKEN